MTHPPGSMTHPPGSMTHPPGSMTHPPGSMTHPPGRMTHLPGSMTHPPGSRHQQSSSSNHLPEHSYFQQTSGYDLVWSQDIILRYWKKLFPQLIALLCDYIVATSPGVPGFSVMLLETAFWLSHPTNSYSISVQSTNGRPIRAQHANSKLTAKGRELWALVFATMKLDPFNLASARWPWWEIEHLLVLNSLIQNIWCGCMLLDGIFTFLDSLWSLLYLLCRCNYYVDVLTM